ncbi:MAG TPA: type IV pilus biogenesis/stability protein PilW [Noviherbaspirillum sp.]|nr:type IV pilus biogenesis/stability protein PilW [Noviherbaspirillum sp.]
MSFARCFSTLAASAALMLLAGCAATPDPTDTFVQAGGSEQTENERRARIRLQLAVGYYEQRQFAVALEELRLALQADPRLADGYSMRGLIFMEMGENKLAEDSFQHALRLAPNAPDYNNNYGWFLCQTGRERQSIAYFENALRSRNYQSPAVALANAGTCSLRVNELAAAERYLLQSFEIDAANPTTAFNLARLYHARRDDERARFYIARVMKADLMTAEVLWLALRIERRLGDRAAEASLANQLRRRFPASPEFAAFQRGAFDE